MNVYLWVNKTDMINLFKRKEVTSKEVEVIEPQQNDYPEIVTQIHNEFNTAGETLLQDAIEILANCNVEVKEKGKLLASLGFKNTPQTKEGESIQNEEDQAKKVSKLVTYYSQKYPFNKFITEHVVRKICNKYNLVFGEVSRFTGFVPATNLKMISEFKADKVDVNLKTWSIGVHGEWLGEEHDDGGNQALMYTSIYKSVIRKEPLQICAPLKDMDTEGMELEGHKLVKKHIPDPVVLHPVNGGYLIVTAWGDEASDEMVVNERFN